jgi:phage shock protein A
MEPHHDGNARLLHARFDSLKAKLDRLRAKVERLQARLALLEDQRSAMRCRTTDWFDL